MKHHTTRVLAAILIGMSIATACNQRTRPSEAATRPYKLLCSEVEYELSQQVAIELISPQRAKQIIQRCYEYAAKEEGA